MTQEQRIEKLEKEVRELRNMLYDKHIVTIIDKVTWVDNKLRLKGFDSVESQPPKKVTYIPVSESQVRNQKTTKINKEYKNNNK